MNKIETRIMLHLFKHCKGKKSILISPADIQRGIADCRHPAKYELTKKQLDVRMKNLVLDGYIDFSETQDKNNNSTYVVTLTTRGEAFQREREQIKMKAVKSLGWKILLTIVACIVTSIFWSIFGGK